VPVFADNFLVAGFAADIEDFRIRADAVVVRVDEDVAEAARESLVLLGIDGLVAKEKRRNPVAPDGSR